MTSGLPDASEVRTSLAGVSYPGYDRDIVSFGLVDAVEVTEGGVDVRLTLTTERLSTRPAAAPDGAEP